MGHWLLWCARHLLFSIHGGWEGWTDLIIGGPAIQWVDEAASGGWGFSTSFWTRASRMLLYCTQQCFRISILTCCSFAEVCFLLYWIITVHERGSRTSLDPCSFDVEQATRRCCQRSMVCRLKYACHVLVYTFPHLRRSFCVADCAPVALWTNGHVFSAQHVE